MSGEPKDGFFFPPSLIKPGSWWEMPRARAAPAPPRRRGGREPRSPLGPPAPRIPSHPFISPHFRAILSNSPLKKNIYKKKKKKEERERGSGVFSPPPSRPRGRPEASREARGGGCGGGERGDPAEQLLPEEGRSEYRVQ